MPPLPVIEDVFRCAIGFQSITTGLHCVNVLHFRSTGSVTHVGEAIADAMEAQEALANPWGPLSGNYTCTGIDVLPLDGVSAGSFFPVTSVQGGGSGDEIPASALVVSLRTAARGPRGRGRVFIGPIGEGDNTHGVLNGGSAEGDGIAANWESFAALLAALTPAVRLVVASYVHADANDVVSFRVDINLGTQRRRQDRVGT